MWLVTYSQKTSANGQPVIANTVLKYGLTPAAWLAGALKQFPDADTVLLFALEIDDSDGYFLNELL